MAVLDKIRQRTTVLIIIIGMALFAFVISGIFTQNGVSQETVIGEINGEEVSITEFRQRLEVAAEQSKTSTTMQLVDQVWNSAVRTKLLEQEFESLGISVEGDQILNFIKNIPVYAQTELFQDENGVFNNEKFIAAVADWKVNNPRQYQLWLQDELAISFNAKEQTFNNLILAGVKASELEGKYNYKAANDKVSISFVKLAYSSIADSLVTVKESEVKAYINDHKEEFKQSPARDLRLVYFPEVASAEDEKAIEAEITSLLEDSQEFDADTNATVNVAGFKNTDDMSLFLDRHSDIKFDTIYKSDAALGFQQRENLVGLSKGEIYGPYKEDGYLKISKMMDVKKNGTAKASHILISWVGAQSANASVTRTKEEAKSMANQLLRQARNANVAEFYQLARDNSDGPSASRGGDLGYFEEGQMVAEFNDFVFGSKVGAIDMIETDFGYHIVKIDDKKDTYQIATLARSLAPSEETINANFKNATSFEMAVSKDSNNFGSIASESNYQVRSVSKVGALEENLPGLGAQRSVIQWAFNDDAAIGAIRKFDLGTGYAVVQLTAIYNEGTTSIADASIKAIPAIRKEKKAQLLKEQYTGKSMDAIASEAKMEIATASALSLSSPVIPGSGREAYIVGKAFGMEEGQESDLIQGNDGVYKIKVTSKMEAEALESYAIYASSIEAQRKSIAPYSIFSAIEKAADIIDNRAVFY